MIFGHGDDSYRYGDKVKMDFSSNLPMFADRSALKAHLATKLDAIGSYPEPEARELEGMLAEELGIPSKQHHGDGRRYGGYLSYRTAL